MKCASCGSVFRAKGAAPPAASQPGVADTRPKTSGLRAASPDRPGTNVRTSQLNPTTPAVERQAGGGRGKWLIALLVLDGLLVGGGVALAYVWPRPQEQSTAATRNEDKKEVTPAPVAPVKTPALPTPEPAPDRAAQALKDLDSEDAEIRKSGCQVLASLREASSTPRIVALLADADAGVADSAARALGQFGMNALPALQESLKHENAEVRKRAVMVVGTIGGAEATPMLLAALGDDDLLVRGEAETALGLNTDTHLRALTVLFEGLKDPDERVRAAAEASVARLGAPRVEALPMYVALLRDRDQSVAAQRYAAAALLKLGKQAEPAMPVLLDAVRPGRDAVVRRDCLVALGNTSGPSKPQAVEILLAAAKDDNPEVSKAARALTGGLESAKAADVPTILQAIQKGEAQHRPFYIAALGRIGPDAAIALAPLVAMLRNASPETRTALFAAIASIDPKEMGGRLGLTELIRDRDPRRRLQGLALVQGSPDTAFIGQTVLFLLDDSDREVRLAAIAALEGAMVNPISAIGRLRRLLKENDADQLIVILERLAAYPPQQSSSAIPELTGLVKNKEVPIDIRRRVVPLLGSMREIQYPATQAVESLVGTDLDAEAKAELMRAVVAKPPPLPMPKPFPLINLDREARIKIFKLIAGIQQANTQAECSAALLALKPPEADFAIQSMTVFLRTNNSKSRINLLEQLERHGPAAKPLVDHINFNLQDSNDPAVQAAQAKALKAIQGE
ncbi:MAG: HEAT repeat domain-containing protein [Gemmataceae bacterium]